MGFEFFQVYVKQTISATSVWLLLNAFFVDFTTTFCLLNHCFGYPVRLSLSQLLETDILKVLACKFCEQSVLVKEIQP